MNGIDSSAKGTVDILRSLTVNDIHIHCCDRGALNNRRKAYEFRKKKKTVPRLADARWHLSAGAPLFKLSLEALELIL